MFDNATKFCYTIPEKSNLYGGLSLMNMENQYGGVLLSLPANTPLPDAMRQNILDRWDSANAEGEIDEMIDYCQTIACPKAFIKAAEIAEADENGCTLDGTRFTGPLIAEKLSNVGATAVGYVITCGRELHDYAESLTDDILMQSAAMDVCLAYLQMIRTEANAYVKETYFPDAHMAVLNPGSLNSWPLSGQRELFAFLGEGADATGIELKESMLMVPYKSGSGVYFKTEKHYENCMRCPKLDCPGRRAPYNEEEA